MEILPILSSLAVLAMTFLLVDSGGKVWDSICHRYVADLQPTLDALSISQENLRIYMRVWGLMLVGAVIVLGVFMGMPPIGIAAAYLVYVAPRFLLKYAIKRRSYLLRDQLVGATIAVANASRAGLSLAQSLEMISGEVPEPLATELRRIVNEFRHGLPLETAIRQVKERLNLDSFTLFASALTAALDRGGKITEALERISQSLLENQRVERKLEADTASGKWVVVILAIFPFLFLGLFLIVNPSGTLTLFRSFIGQFILFIVIVLVYISVHWSQRILAIEA